MASIFIIQILFTLFLFQKSHTTKVFNTLENKSEISTVGNNFTDIINFIFRYNTTKLNDVVYTTPSSLETTETESTTDDYNTTTTEIYFYDEIESRIGNSAIVASLLG